MNSGKRTGRITSVLVGAAVAIGVLALRILKTHQELPGGIHIVLIDQSVGF